MLGVSLRPRMLQSVYQAPRDAEHGSCFSLRETRCARLSDALNHGCIEARRTATFPRSSPLLSVGHVVGRCACVQVVRANTSWYITKVADASPMRHIAISKYPRVDMSADCSTVYVDSPVSVVSHRSCPQPAAIRLVDATPEPLLSRWSRIHATRHTRSIRRVCL